MFKPSEITSLLLITHKIQQPILIIFYIFYLLIIHQSKGFAQIIPDNNLPSPSLTVTSGNVIEIQGGTQAGSNLFHSFEQFSVNTGNTAFFKNPLVINNIITRVTGSSISQIDGLIRTNGQANLFLINPNGIIFGTNASLNIGGSFLASTANSIKFSDGSIYSAVNPQQQTLLTINTPLGLQYGVNPGNITVQGPGNQLFVNEFFATSRENRPVGLEVKAGNTLALVGGDVYLAGGNLTAGQGRVEIGAVKDSFVTINYNTSGLNLSYEGVNNFADINLNAAASIDVSGDGSGYVQVIGKNINLTDGSAILANTEHDLNGGSIKIKAADLLNVSGFNSDSGFSTIISTDVSPEARGSGGSIDIVAHKLTASDGGQISSTTFGLGTGGTVNIQAEDIELASGADLGPSGIFASTDSGGGNAGKIAIATNNLLVTDGAQISTTSWFGEGNAGEIQITAKKAQFIGTAFGQYPSGLLASTYSDGNGGNIFLNTDTLAVKDGAQIQNSAFATGSAGQLEITATNIELSGTYSGKIASGLFSNVEQGATGNGGLLKVKTENLSLFDGAAIVAKTAGSGNAGKIEIAAKTIEIRGESNNPLPTIIAANVQSQATGAGGELNINTDTLYLRNGGQIATSTFGIGNAGVLTIQANDINLSGFISGGSSGLFSNAVTNSGNGGQLNISTDKLTIQDGATIAASNFSSRNPNLAPGTGLAGDIKIDARLIELFNSTASNIKSSINATTFNGGGGNIQINVKASLAASNNSLITADTKGNANGGTIRVNTNLLSLNSGANLSTNSIGLGQAGDIFINANQVRANHGLITATATQSGGGNISLNNNFLFLQNNSLISSSVTDSTGGGGNLFINSDFIVIHNNSDIRANAIFGTGGNIQIHTQALFHSQDSEIDASSTFGIDGVVKITNPEDVQKIAIAELPKDMVDATQLVAKACSASKTNEFVIIGKGGLPENPTNMLRGQTVWTDLRQLSTNSNTQNKLAAASQEKLASTSPTSTHIIEAQGWVINRDGTIELVAHPPEIPTVLPVNYVAKCTGS
ncbi:filamentous hemagglutinin N-terminal domain-containing protein [Calothrix sp. FACHB-156]|nr:filamentous hemagglutinin N-terminal domain-containing protein [Calothrix sp. FACHB-156]